MSQLLEEVDLGEESVELTNEGIEEGARRGAGVPAIHSPTFTNPAHKKASLVGDKAKAAEDETGGGGGHGDGDEETKGYADFEPGKKTGGCSRMSGVTHRHGSQMLLLFLAMLEWTQANSTGSEVCFDAASWARSFKQKQGFRVFSQGYQDSVLASLFHHEHLGTNKRKFVEFGFHVADVNGTANFSSVRGRHPTLRELPGYGANFELLQRKGWSGVRFDGDEHSALIPNMRQAFITPQNVVPLFRQHKIPLDVDYVSIDVDSCDLWIFLALTDVYRPTVITIEYNSNYAFNESLTNVCTSPSDGSFFTSGAFTKNHWGWSASLAAINKAATRRGYAVVWVEPWLDIFLVRLDRLCQPYGIPPLHQFEFATGLRLHVGRKPQRRHCRDRTSPSCGLDLFRKWIAEYH